MKKGRLSPIIFLFICNNELAYYKGPPSSGSSVSCVKENAQKLAQDGLLHLCMLIVMLRIIVRIVFAIEIPLWALVSIISLLSASMANNIPSVHSRSTMTLSIIPHP